jgi:hypothetical protein
LIDLLRKVYDEAPGMYLTNEETGTKDYPFALDYKADEERLLVEVKKHIDLSLSHVRLAINVETQRDGKRENSNAIIALEALSTQFGANFDSVSLKSGLRSADSEIEKLLRKLNPLNTSSQVPSRTNVDESDTRTSLEMSMKLKPGEAVPTDIKVSYVDPAVAALAAENAARDKTVAESERRANPPNDDAICDSRGKATHGPGFVSVNWFGVTHDFTPGIQAEAIRHLWAEYKRGGHGIANATLGPLAGSSSTKFRLKTNFRLKGGQVKDMHPAWGTMIEEVGEGVYRLRAPK